ncbi:MAG: hypothetical protein GX348_11520 [Veillonellaceae bacterium]|nr:hypothetical protein [Veillonellaceae bacterium]
MVDDRKSGCCDCCNDIRDIVACVCSLDKEFECVEEALGHCDNQTKAKVLTCVILREIKELDHKLNRIIRHLKCPQ